MNKYSLLIILFFTTQFYVAQSFVTADHQSFNAQQLIENLLFGDTDCVENINVTEAVSGNFNDGMLSYGAFNANNSDFPFESGLVLSTGRLDNTEGPNNSLSDDDAPGWGGDQDLRDALNIPDDEVITNATSITFNFVPQANQLSFRYIFASEEYQENNVNTCVFSDVFAFLIRPINGEFENVALVPGTDTPVKVTTVRPEIPGGCEALNEEWFGQFNQGPNAATSPTNFNGQTKTLVATANLTPGQTYEVKLVIADEGNFRYDSAVYLEAGSFDVGVDLGGDRIDDNAVCEDDEVLLEVIGDNYNEINWFYNDNPIENNSNSQLVSETELGAGTYRVEVELEGGCIAENEVVIEFQSINPVDDFSLITCASADSDVFNFNLLDIQSQVDEAEQNLSVDSFYFSQTTAENTQNPIQNPESFSPQNNVNQVFVRLTNPGDCEIIVPVSLSTNTEFLNPIEIIECPDFNSLEISFNSQAFRNLVFDEVGFETSSARIFTNLSNALLSQNQIIADNFFLSQEELPTTYYVRLDETGECAGIVPVEINTPGIPQFTADDQVLALCANQEQDLEINAGVSNANANTNYLWNTGETSASILVDEPGEYSVIVSNTLTNSSGEEVSCEDLRTFEVISSGIVSASVQLIGTPGNNQQAVVSVIGDGDFEYALNNYNFQESNTFTVEQSNNIVFVRDLNGCGIVSVRFVAIQFPEFFTPNGDGVNDGWRPRGVTAVNTDLVRIDIFDRFGKRLVSLSPGNAWDGTYNGRPMPSNDYWFQAVFRDGSTYKSNLTLKR
ncbi:MAG: T9SS type B sorting domain-containing protein [Flavobacteriaceae bacterium]|nr:T9SS type B sorting domain-containing protein [Flavobacteriaceae bacterium]